ncbi:hypothetical protein BCR36DRAFT_344092 [Piromyces finnis]|uniref:SH3 domain-containing protein n=1 Tax=Piromyces finnis TaxID=1754191 RepID=A0A1Y1VKL6_9FUNG|nr:hypothetical protein BCR36DRAFT_344092 [Piromyces finnis]|eukprot:ORX58621.1 hypothetical protein BCR36DRAFT_344092 [Piromyces finnis]
MKNLSFNLLFFVVLILFTTVHGFVVPKEDIFDHKKLIHEIKTELKTKEHKIANTVVTKHHDTAKNAPKEDLKPAHKEVSKEAPKHAEKKVEKKVEEQILKPLVSVKEPIEMESPKPEVSNPVPIKSQDDSKDKSGEKSSHSGTITFVGLALVAVAAGGVTYRGKAKKQMKSPELFKYKFENNAIYDFTPKDSSLTYSFNPNDYNLHEEQPRINFYEDQSVSRSKRNSGSLSTEVIYEDASTEETRNFNIILPTNRAYKAVLPWDARCVDEIQLNCGDLVCIKECYQDGYSLGRNLTTRFDGIFPTCCLSNIGSTVNQAEVYKWQTVGMYSLPKRSVKPTKKAKRASRGISLLTMPDWTKKLESLKLDTPSTNTIF